MKRRPAAPPQDIIFLDGFVRINYVGPLPTGRPATIGETGNQSFDANEQLNRQIRHTFR